MADRQIALSELKSLTGGADDLDVVQTVQRAKAICKGARVCALLAEEVKEAQAALDEAKRRQEIANLSFAQLVATAK